MGAPSKSAPVSVRFIYIYPHFPYATSLPTSSEPQPPSLTPCSREGRSNEEDVLSAIYDCPHVFPSCPGCWRKMARADTAPSQSPPLARPAAATTTTTTTTTTVTCRRCGITTANSRFIRVTYSVRALTVINQQLRLVVMFGSQLDQIFGLSAGDYYRWFGRYSLSTGQPAHALVRQLLRTRLVGSTWTATTRAGNRSIHQTNLAQTTGSGRVPSQWTSLTIDLIGPEYQPLCYTLTGVTRFLQANCLYYSDMQSWAWAQANRLQKYTYSADPKSVFPPRGTGLDSTKDTKPDTTVVLPQIKPRVVRRQTTEAVQREIDGWLDMITRAAVGRLLTSVSVICKSQNHSSTNLTQLSHVPHIPAIDLFDDDLDKYLAELTVADWKAPDTDSAQLKQARHRGGGSDLLPSPTPDLSSLLEQVQVIDPTDPRRADQNQAIPPQLNGLPPQSPGSPTVVVTDSPLKVASPLESSSSSTISPSVGEIVAPLTSPTNLYDHFLDDADFPANLLAQLSDFELMGWTPQKSPTVTPGNASAIPSSTHIGSGN
ncbi:hypothetical protein BJ085DRAFT_40663 [Dimargaris cristalligena]|uniref:Uncharacterized protein n=1 Tax=Dimargaris cristalligena TaxID=215637 RepID=A0A4P9ZQ60_9FUNG|nr:hypothetical protein BJ085DRAFT_40663 [Dimargaris cristalligena]|eukprot:RKP35604.1 hypothetical protein BJ085DRAFT_40663 [Dimargaris cristalligena]